jgi:hypothetical protein
LEIWRDRREKPREIEMGLGKRELEKGRSYKQRVKITDESDAQFRGKITWQ